MARFEEIETFVQVVESGGFRAAAERLGLTASSVSKRVQALEERLGARLLNRTTRRVAPTDVGRALAERARGVLSELEDAETAVAELQAEPQGLLRLGAPMDFGRRYLAEPLAGFAATHPAIQLDLQLTDRFVDVVGEGFDVVVRIATLRDSGLVARRLAPCRRVLVASPGYLAEHGAPEQPDDLGAHDFLAYTPDRLAAIDGFPQPLRERHRADNGELIRELARAGQGVAFLPTFLVGDDLRDGALIEVLRGAIDGHLGIHALTPHRKLLSTKVRLLLDHLRERLGPEPAWDRDLGLD